MSKPDFWNLNADENKLVFDYDRAVEYMRSVEWDFEEEWLRQELIARGWTPPNE